MRQAQVIEQIFERLDRLEDVQDEIREEIDCLRHQINVCREDDTDEDSYSPTDDPD